MNLGLKLKKTPKNDGLTNGERLQLPKNVAKCNAAKAAKAEATRKRHAQKRLEHIKQTLQDGGTYSPARRIEKGKRRGQRKRVYLLSSEGREVRRGQAQVNLALIHERNRAHGLPATGSLPLPEDPEFKGTRSKGEAALRETLYAQLLPNLYPETDCPEESSELSVTLDGYVTEYTRDIDALLNGQPISFQVESVEKYGFFLKKALARLPDAYSIDFQGERHEHSYRTLPDYAADWYYYDRVDKDASSFLIRALLNRLECALVNTPGEITRTHYYISPKRAIAWRDHLPPGLHEKEFLALIHKEDRKVIDYVARFYEVFNPKAYQVVGTAFEIFEELKAESPDQKDNPHWNKRRIANLFFYALGLAKEELNYDDSYQARHRRWRTLRYADLEHRLPTPPRPRNRKTARWKNSKP
jgi:hypothetical protein